ncbi:HAD family hydrolase, partial [Streptomyces sp. GbtcB7]|uniref:HAD family hydrolase n=1 Tax=Streptomyces sp. GbtcB7 TaxID=2824752 RepID=UPI001C308905
MAAPTAYSLIATDLDGTLLRGADTLSDRSRAALERGAEAGARHLGVTGRPAPGERPLLAELGGAGV